MLSSSPPLVIAGFHRSGTSLTARSLHAAGLRLGDGLIEAGPSNPDGHFEHEGIVRFHDRLLVARGRSWDIPAAGCDTFTAEEKQEARSLVEPLACSEAGPWGFKDPRVCLFLPLWNEVLDDPLKLIVYRDPVACMNSLLRREAQALAHQTQADADSIALWCDPNRAITLWCDYNEALLREHKRAPERSLIMSFTALVTGTSPSALVNQHTDIGLDTAVCPDVHGTPPTVAQSIVAIEDMSASVRARAADLLDELNACFDGPAESLGEYPSADGTATHAPARDTLVRALDALGVARPGVVSDTTRAVWPASQTTGASADVTADDTEQKRARALALDAKSNADPAYAGLATVAGSAWLAVGDLDAARRCFSRAVRSGAPDHTADLHLGVLARDAGDDDTALGHFLAALERVPTHGGLHAHIAHILIRKGEVQRGIALARAGLEHEPAQSQLLNIVLDAAMESGDPASVTDIVQRAQTHDPGDWQLAQWRYRIALASANGHERQTQALRLRALALRLPGIANVGARIHEAIDAIDTPHRQAALMQAVAAELEAMQQPLRKPDVPVVAVVPDTERCSIRSPADIRLGMSILARDERDVIEANIRYHASVGVERFVVTDNGSVDGTRECLRALCREFDIDIIDEPSRTIDQDLWVTRMAERVRAHGDIDWLINNDADEFWWPATGDLRSAISQDIGVDADAIGVVQVARSNLVASRESASRSQAGFDTAIHRVRQTVKLPPDARRWHDNDAHILLRTLPGKVITRLQGLKSIDMGNHGAEHSLGSVQADSIHIHHYPVRSFAQFESKVRNYGESLEQNTRFGPRVSRHLRYWYERYLAGELREEYLQMHPTEHDLQQLLRDGFVDIDDRLDGRLHADITHAA